MSNFKVLLVYPNLPMVNLLPSNIAVLSAYLKEHGIEVKLFDTTLYKREGKSVDEIRVEHLQLRSFDLSEKGVLYKDTDMLKDFETLINTYKPDLVGVSVTEDTSGLGMVLIDKMANHSAHVIVGGVYATFSPEDVIKNDRVDSVCIGEGEEALLELCVRLREGKEIADIKNLWVRRNGKVYKNALRKLVDIEKLPFEDFSIFEEKRFFRPMQGKVYGMLPICTDRGCPYDCAFCAAPANRKLYSDEGRGNYFRMKSVSRIMSEIKFQAAKHKVNYIYFNSETLFARTDADFEAFAKEYIEKIGLPFWCQTRVETINKKKVALLKRMNCDRISIGIEHGNEKFRKKMLKKTFTNKQAIEAFDILGNSGISITVNNILGFPDETRELVFDTVRLNRNIKADSINAYFFVPYHGTPLREYCIRKGYLDTHAKTETPIISSILNMPQISREQLKGLVRTFPLYVKMPESYFDDIRIAERLDDEGGKMFSRLREIYFKEYFKPR